MCVITCAITCVTTARIVAGTYVRKALQGSLGMTGVTMDGSMVNVTALVMASASPSPSPAVAASPRPVVLNDAPAAGTDKTWMGVGVAAIVVLSVGFVGILPSTWQVISCS